MFSKMKNNSILWTKIVSETHIFYSPENYVWIIENTKK